MRVEFVTCGFLSYKGMIIGVVLNWFYGLLSLCGCCLMRVVLHSFIPVGYGR